MESERLFEHCRTCDLVKPVFDGLHVAPKGLGCEPVFVCMDCVQLHVDATGEAGAAAVRALRQVLDDAEESAA